MYVNFILLSQLALMWMIHYDYYDSRHKHKHNATFTSYVVRHSDNAHMWRSDISEESLKVVQSYGGRHAA